MKKNVPLYKRCTQRKRNNDRKDAENREGHKTVQKEVENMLNDTSWLLNNNNNKNGKIDTTKPL